MKVTVLFFSPNQAIWANDVLTSAGFPCRMIPVPRNLSSDCGYCVQVETEDTEEIKATLNENQIEFDRIEIS